MEKLPVLSYTHLVNRPQPRFRKTAWLVIIGWWLAGLPILAMLGVGVSIEAGSWNLGWVVRMGLSIFILTTLGFLVLATRKALRDHSND